MLSGLCSQIILALLSTFSSKHLRKNLIPPYISQASKILERSAENNPKAAVMEMFIGGSLELALGGWGRGWERLGEEARALETT